MGCDLREEVCSRVLLGGLLVSEIPKLMHTMAISAPGGPEVLQLAERAVPQPGPGQVLVRVSHAGVNRPDCLQRAGLYPPPPNASDLPGLEIAGNVVAVGQGAGAEMLGQQVCALVNGGGYAEYCLAMAGHCLPVPRGLSLAEAAAMPETLFTVWHNVFQRGMVRDGEVLLVHGGTSGIGTMAIKLATLFGVTVIATCGSDDKCAAALEVGANHAINYRTADFVEQVKGVTGGMGADVILDVVAASYTQRNLDCLATEGRLVTIATLGGPMAEVHMGKLMVRRQTMTGSTLRPRSDAFKTALADDIAQNVWPLVAEGALRPQMDRSFALAAAADAHRRMEAGEHVGKIVLDLTGED
jgi:NADPH:quinone reductase